MFIDWSLAARDGAVLSVGAGALIAGMLRLNPRLFLADFPESVRRALPPKTAAERRLSLAGGLALIAWTLTVIGASTAAAESRGAADFLSLAAHAFLVGTAFNLFDWLIIDELWLGCMPPRWAYPPGIEPAQVPFEHARHFFDFLKGSALFAIIGALTALVVWWT